MNPAEVCLYSSVVSGIPLRLVSMNLDIHGASIHSWSKQFYTVDYWKRNGDFMEFIAYYEKRLKNNKDLMLVAYFDQYPLSLIEIYPMRSHRLATGFTVGADIYGIHLLMAPFRVLSEIPAGSSKEIVLAITQSVLEFVFFGDSASAVYVEVDIRNNEATGLAETAGFSQVQVTEESNHVLVLYEYKKEDFLSKYPKPERDTSFNLFADSFIP